MMDMKVSSQGGQINLDNFVNQSELSKGGNSIKGQDNFMPITKGNKDVQGKRDINDKELNKALQKLNGFLSDENAHATLSYHEDTNRLMVTVYDKDDEIVMQIPSEKILDMVAKMSKFLGVSVDKKA
ncbi:MAG: flagellar protein FlaG [Clostridiales bacterium]|nr:flagellar protein FlaG [Clostridiales bacterium]